MPTGAAAGEGLEALLTRLRRMTPMPPDEQLNPTLFRAYTEIVTKIAAVFGRDPRAVGPLIASLGPGTARGAYERVLEQLEAFPLEVTGPAFVAALERGTLGPRRWAAVALGRLAYVPAAAALKAAVEDDDALVRRNADLSLRMLSAAAPDAIPSEDDEGPDPLFEGIAEP